MTPAGRAQLHKPETNRPEATRARHAKQGEVSSAHTSAKALMAGPSLLQLPTAHALPDSPCTSIQQPRPGTPTRPSVNTPTLCQHHRLWVAAVLVPLPGLFTLLQVSRAAAAQSRAEQLALRSDAASKLTELSNLPKSTSGLCSHTARSPSSQGAVFPAGTQQQGTHTRTEAHTCAKQRRECGAASASHANRREEQALTSQRPGCCVVYVLMACQHNH